MDCIKGSYQLQSEFVRRGVPGTAQVINRILSKFLALLGQVVDSAFVLGQEPDAPSPRGGYEASQAFVGDITELNLWDTEVRRTAFILCVCELWAAAGGRHNRAAGPVRGVPAGERPRLAAGQAAPQPGQHIPHTGIFSETCSTSLLCAGGCGGAA